MKSTANFRVIGVMSGTSLDGLDIACCQFTKKEKWTFKILSAKTFPYSEIWKKKLSSAHLLSSIDLHALHAEYGNFIGTSVRAFVQKKSIKNIDLIASHGHTVFHQPEKSFTFQLGDGNSIRAASNLPVIFDFRSLDVVLGGQGAPLVPVGDRMLFGAYDACLNLGGIANLSMEQGGKRIAFDICFANMGLNYLAQKNGKNFDAEGMLAEQGVVNHGLLESLDKINARWHKARPALAREHFESLLRDLLDRDLIPVSDRLRTFCESIVREIRLAIPAKRKIKLLATGGGALNPFLIDLLRKELGNAVEVIVPDRQIIEFKEALVFGFLGVLRRRGEINVLKSVTRARKDSCSGVIVGDPK